jgi:hypothetical protein
MENKRKKLEEMKKINKAEAKLKKQQEKHAERKAKSLKSSGPTSSTPPTADDQPHSDPVTSSDKPSSDQPGMDTPKHILIDRSNEADCVRSVRKELDWLDPSFISSEESFEICIRPILENETLIADYIRIIDNLLDFDVRTRNAMNDYALSRLEASCIIIYTMELSDVTSDPALMLNHSFYRKYNETLSQRDASRIRDFQHYSYHLNCALQKMPKIIPSKPVDLYRGLYRSFCCRLISMYLSIRLP